MGARRRIPKAATEITMEENMLRKTNVVVGFLFLVLTNNGSAQDFGNWHVDTSSEDAVYAATGNDSGAVFGQFCFLSAGSCYWFLGMSTACEKDAQYPVLANSDAGAWKFDVVCNGQIPNGMYRYVFSDFNTVDALVRKGSRLGIAFPMKGDQFLVSRFLLNGSVTALTVMRAAAEKKTTPAHAKTRDQIM